MPTNLPLFKLPFHHPFSPFQSPELPQKFHGFIEKAPPRVKNNRPFICKRRLLCLVCLYHFFNLFFLKGVLTESADGALEVLCNLFPRRAGSDSLAGLSNFGVVFISTRVILFHSKIPAYKSNLNLVHASSFCFLYSEGLIPTSFLKTFEK